jgi:hypothetical protein
MLGFGGHFLTKARHYSATFADLRAARVPRITVHGTGKTCASLLAALDVHPRVAMRILRHSKIAVTMEIYTEAPSDATHGQRGHALCPGLDIRPGSASAHPPTATTRACLRSTPVAPIRLQGQA